MMAADNSTGITDARAQAERENQIELTLLRGVVENLRGNRIVVPLFGLAIVAMFPQWVGSNHLAGWYCQMMLGLVPQVIVLSRFPAGLVIYWSWNNLLSISQQRLLMWRMNRKP